MNIFVDRSNDVRPAVRVTLEKNGKDESSHGERSEKDVSQKLQTFLHPAEIPLYFRHGRFLSG